MIHQNAPEYRGEYDLPSFKKEPIPNAPKVLRFSTADTGFDRYYAHPKFAEIGFVPYESRTEDIYNANSTWGDDWSRMWDQYGGPYQSAFFSSYRAIGDLFDGDYIGAGDFEGAMQMENAMKIGNSTRGGFAQFANNFALNSAYTVGILSNIAAEEVVLALGSAAVSATGVGAAPGAAAFTAGTIRNAARGIKAVTDFFDISRYVGATSQICLLYTSPSPRDRG